MRDDAGTVLFKTREVGRQAQVDAGMRLCYLERFLNDLDALALEHVRKARIVLEMAVIERRDQLVGSTIPIMKHRRDDATRLEPWIQPDAVVHLQRGRMIGAGPRHLLEEIAFSQRRDDGNRHALLGERQRQAKPPRAGTAAN